MKVTAMVEVKVEIEAEDTALAHLQLLAAFPPGPVTSCGSLEDVDYEVTAVTVRICSGVEGRS